MKEYSKGDQRNSFIREVVTEKGVKGYGVILSYFMTLSNSWYFMNSDLKNLGENGRSSVDIILMFVLRNLEKPCKPRME